jgi:hypothetical protein
VEVALAAPERVSEEEWRCALRVKWDESVRTDFAHGLDALQALINAIEGIRSALLERHEEMSWPGGEPGDPGIPRFVPQFFGLNFANQMNRILDEEIERFATRAKAGTKE